MRRNFFCGVCIAVHGLDKSIQLLTALNTKARGAGKKDFIKNVSQILQK